MSFAEVLLGLGHIHQARVIYRDVKLENTLVALDGHIMLADFGVSKRLLDDRLDEGHGSGKGGSAEGGSSHDGSALPGAASSRGAASPSSTSTMIGTPIYMAPEQLRGEAYSFEVDWWAMAVMLHEMLTGEAVGSCRSKPPTILTDKIGDEDAADLITSMLRWTEPSTRLGYGDGEGATIQAHPYFAKHTDFGALLKKEVKGPLLIEGDASMHAGQKFAAQSGTCSARRTLQRLASGE